MTLSESTPVVFLYMDEKYMDTRAPAHMQVLSLTGLLVSANAYPLFRDRLFRLLPDFAEGVEALHTRVHASDLFRNLPDKEHFLFYDGLVSTVNALACRVYRRGFNFIPGDRSLRKGQQTMLWNCFRSMLIAAVESEGCAQIWPVVEIDNSEGQDRSFAGYVRWMDHATAHLQVTGDGVDELIDDHQMVDNTKIGDVHYISKTSIMGSAVDCLTYLLHCKWLRDNEHELTNYKKQLAEIASHIDTSLLDDYIATYRAD